MASEVLKSLLLDLRQHPAFPELLAAVEKPRIPQFRKSKAASVEEARADWIFTSGQVAQHNKWLLMLTGQVPQDAE